MDRSTDYHTLREPRMKHGSNTDEKQFVAAFGRCLAFLSVVKSAADAGDVQDAMQDRRTIAVTVQLQRRFPRADIQ